MRCMIKKILSCVLMVAMLMPMMAAASSADGASQDMKVSEELMDKLGVSQNELKSGDYQLSDNKISCIIWIEDIDMEVPVKAGIEAAERTKPVSLRNMTRPNEAAAYEVMNINGYKLVDVNLEDSADDTYVQAYIATERSVAANMYSQKNASFVEDCLEEQDTAVNYVSNYSPCVFADLSIDEIAELNENENVCRIGYWDDSPCAVEASSDAFTAAERANLNTHINIIRANTARTTYGVTGDGVRIGQIEPGVSQDAIKINSNDSTDSHADRVYTVMHTVAPDAVYYAISSGSGFYSGIESLISNGVNIINFSAGWATYNTYDERSRWVDHLAYNHDVHFVKSAGNEGGTGVTSPGMAYNIITVGNTNMTSPYAINNSSSYNNGGANISSNLTFKPDISAPGTYNSSGRSGTSYAAPLVTGTIALMCEYQPALKTKQHIVKAILAASASKDSRYTTGYSTFKEYGAGLLDAHAAIWVIYKGNYSSTTGSLSSVSASRSYNMTVTSGDTSMRVALAYANRIQFSSGSGHAGSTAPSGTIGEMKLEVLSPSGALVRSCAISGANLKIVQFDPRSYGTGTYTIKVTLTSLSSNGTTNFGVAWR